MIEKKLQETTSTFKNFLTNQGNNTLEYKLQMILKKNHIGYADFLIGYFRITGFNKIAPYLETIDEARILVGMDIDRATFEANSKAQNIERLSKEQIVCFNNEVNIEKYQSVELLVQLLSQKSKLRIRMAPNNDIHAKLYILRDTKEPYSDSVGSVIIGSSNLTHNGLKGNFEINTQLNSASQIDEATQIFNILWEDSVELTLADVNTQVMPKLEKYVVQNEDSVKPFDKNNIYYHTLAHYFSEIIENDLEIDSEVKLFKFQKDAVNTALLKLNKFNGAILGDVVGLGKTVIATAILKVLNIEAMIIAPPSTHPQWESTLEKFHISKENYTLYSYDKLPKSTQAKMVVLDESHKLKNHKSSRYQKIEKLCKTPFRKKVLLLSATLQNNSPEDIANQIYLFQDRNESNLPHIVSLEKFFAPHIKAFNALKHETDKTLVTSTLQSISSDIKNNILKPLLVRRTRTDIENHTMYQKDIGKFPKVDSITPLKYELQGLSEDFQKTIEALESKITYERFRVLNNLNEKGKSHYKQHNPHISDNIFEDNDLSTLAKYALIKRFESSVSAFKISIDNAISALRQFIKDLENNKLYVGEKSSQILNRDTTKKEYLYEGDKRYYFKITKDNPPKKIYLKGVVFEQKEFKKPQSYLNRLKRDLEILCDLQALWKTHNQDPKFDTFLQILKEKKEKKIVVFTEYGDTLHYLKQQLSTSPNNEILFISSQNRKENEEIIAQNFDANDENQKDDYRIIITTDTLAEGVNLHRSDTLINYDLPWNSTKLMQRMGRINRIGSAFERLNVSSFQPVDASNKVIGIMEKSFIKLQSFHYTLGEDSKILFDDEIVESFGVVEESDEELAYLQEIRDFRQNHPKAYDIMIQTKESAVHIQSDEVCELAFFKVGGIAYFYQDITTKEAIDFLTFIKSLTPHTQSTPIGSKIDDFIHFYTQRLNTKRFTKNDKKKTNKQDKQAISSLRKWHEEKKIETPLFEKLRNLILSKSIQSLPKEIVSLKPNDKAFIQSLETLSQPQLLEVEMIDTSDVSTKIYIQKGIK